MSGYVSGGSSVVLRHGSDGVVWGFRACSAGTRPIRIKLRKSIYVKPIVNMRKKNSFIIKLIIV